jgi:histidinol-phosphatase (PHP family)
MIDAHVHIERGPYKIEWVEQFVRQAVERGVQTLYLLEHSHRFIEFSSLYSEVVNYNSYQRDWLNSKMQVSLDEYQNLIKRVRDYKWPIDLRFGLEICYIKGKEQLIYDTTKYFDWDFLTGSVHWLDGWGFDHRAEFWEGQDKDEIYSTYYSTMTNLIKSGLFNILAHPDSIKCFGHNSSKDLSDIYKAIALLLKTFGMQVEQSAGLFLNYNHHELGMNKRLLHILKDNEVNIITATDAHKPEDVGAYLPDLQQLIID